MKLSKLLLFLSFFFISCFLILTMMLFHDQSALRYYDCWFFHHVAFLSEHCRTFFKGITTIGAPKVVFGLTILISLILKNKYQRVFLLSNVMSNLLLNQVLKELIQRPRPRLNHLVQATGFSFPSGHAMATTALIGSLILIYYQTTKKKQLPFLLIVIAFIIIISRPILHVHYFSDILAGTCLASGITLLIYLIFFENPLTNNHYDQRN